MATSIAFGELFATLIVLYLVPVTYSLYWSAGGRFVVAESEGDEVGPDQAELESGRGETHAGRVRLLPS